MSFSVLCLIKISTAFDELEAPHRSFLVSSCSLSWVNRLNDRQLVFFFRFCSLFSVLCSLFSVLCSLMWCVMIAVVSSPFAKITKLCTSTVPGTLFVPKMYEVWYVCNRLLFVCLWDLSVCVQYFGNVLCLHVLVRKCLFFDNCEDLSSLIRHHNIKKKFIIGQENVENSRLILSVYSMFWISTTVQY